MQILKHKTTSAALTVSTDGKGTIFITYSGSVFLNIPLNAVEAAALRRELSEKLEQITT